MSNVIYISATEARKRFFELCQQVSEHGMTYVVQKRNQDVDVVLQPRKQPATSRDKEIKLESVFGSLKPKVPYHPKETTLAHLKYGKEHED